MSIPDPCPSWPVLAELVDGVLSESACRDLDEHLDRCSQCRLAIGMIATGSWEDAGVPVSELEVGSAVGRYVVEAELGRGAMGIVYRAFDQELRRTVALKVPLRRRSDATASTQLREARVLASIRHPNVVEIYDVVGERFIAMELIDGQTLRAWQRGVCTWRPIVRAYLQAAAGLAAAHRVGVVHRDFKPDNVLVDAQGRVAVTDFGLADPGATEEEPHATWGGTPAYMAPEQVAGAPSSEVSDQYSFFVALQEACTGVHPRAEQAGRRIPHRLRRMIARGTREDPASRFADMDAVRHALESLLAPRRGLAIAAVAVVTGALAVAADPSSSCDHSLANWTTDAKARVEQGLLAAGLPADYAATKAQTVAVSLEAHRQRWDEASLVACHEESVGARACLDEQAAHLESLVGALERADRSAAIEVASLLAELPTVGTCDDASAPAGFDATMVPAVERLTQARIALRLGRLDQAQATIDDLDPELATPTFVIRRERVRAGLELARDQLADAQRRLEAAHRLAVRHGLHRHAADLATTLSELIGVDLHRPDDAGPWIAEAERAAWLSGSDEARVAQLRARARVEWRAGRLDDADATLAEAFVLAGDRLPPEHRLVSALWLVQGAVAFRRAEHERAQAAYERALHTVLAASGPADADVGVALQGLSTVASVRGENEAALEAGRWAHAQAARLLGAEHPRTAEALAQLAVLVDRSGDSPEAEHLGREAIDIMEASDASDPAHLAAAYVNLGYAQAEQGRLEEALANHRKALAVYEAMDPVVPWAIADAQTSTGRLLHLTGRTEEALALTRDSVALIERVEGDRSTHLVWPLLSLGDLLTGDHPERALATFERALSIANVGAVDPKHHASALASVAELSLALSDDPDALARALSLARQAESILIEVDAEGPEGLGMLRPLLEQLEARVD